MRQQGEAAGDDSSVDADQVEIEARLGGIDSDDKDSRRLFVPEQPAAGEKEALACRPLLPTYSSIAGESRRRPDPTVGTRLCTIINRRSAHFRSINDVLFSRSSKGPLSNHRKIAPPYTQCKRS